MKAKKLNTDVKKVVSIVAQTAQERKESHDFKELLRRFEREFASGSENVGYTALELAKAAARSVTKEVADPQRRKATERTEVSNSGANPVIVSMRREINTDTALLEKTARLANLATAVRYDADGNATTEVVDKNADEALTKIIRECAENGIDLVQEGAGKLWELARVHGYNGEGWLERPFNVRRLRKKVYPSVVLCMTEEEKRRYMEKSYIEVETTPIEEVYREIRRLIEKSRAGKNESKNLYIEEVDEGLEGIFYRLKRCADLGGYVSTIDGKRDYSGLYTADLQTVTTSRELIEIICTNKNGVINENQMSIVYMLLCGCSLRDIAEAKGIKHQSVANTIKRIRANCERIGFTPAMWAEMTGALEKE